MKKNQRGALSMGNLMTVVMLALLAWVVFYPKYAQAKLRKDFNAAIEAGETIYNAAQRYYIQKGIWPSAMGDLSVNIDAKPVSAWEVASKVYSCQLSYGRGDQKRNEISCSPIGKFASVLSYQIVLADNSLHKRYCRATKTNQKANDLCKEIGGVFSHNVAGSATPTSVYVVQQ